MLVVVVAETALKAVRPVQAVQAVAAQALRRRACLERLILAAVVVVVGRDMVVAEQAAPALSSSAMPTHTLPQHQQLVHLR